MNSGNSECEPCDEKCLVCSGSSTNCSSCNNPVAMDSTSGCTCKPGYTYNSSTKDCDCSPGRFIDGSGSCLRMELKYNFIFFNIYLILENSL